MQTLLGCAAQRAQQFTKPIWTGHLRSLALLYVNYFSGFDRRAHDQLSLERATIITHARAFGVHGTARTDIRVRMSQSIRFPSCVGQQHGNAIVDRIVGRLVGLQRTFP